MNTRGRPRPHPAPQRDDTGRALASRQLICREIGLTPDVARRRLTPVACDVTTRAALIDLDDVAQLVATLRV